MKKTIASSLIGSAVIAGFSLVTFLPSHAQSMSGNKQVAQVSIVAPLQGDTIPSDHYAIEVQITVPKSEVGKIPVTPSFISPTSPNFKAGASQAFPGLVVTDTGTAQKVGGPQKNLAGLFQIIAVRHNLAGDEVVDADWFVGKPLFSMNNMPCIRAYVVTGKAPDTIAANPTNKDIGMNFHGFTPLSNIAKTDVYTMNSSTNTSM